MENRLDRLRDALLVQCFLRDVARALQVADQPGTGLVVTTDRYDDVGRLAGVMGERALLVDAARYAGGQRLPASADFDRRWLRVQRDAGLPVLTDSGYVAEDDEKGLLSVLRRTADLRRAGDVVATLALHPVWLHPDRGLDRLLTHVRRVGVPIAIVLEHEKDPLRDVHTLHGLLALLAVGVPVVQLRCDVSGLGLLCHGAWAAAVGTHSRLRHLYPRREPGGGPGHLPSVSTVVKECLSYLDVNKIAVAVQADPDDSLWRACNCRTCRARPLDWIARLPDRPARERAAFGHALEMLFDLRDGLLVRGDPEDRQRSWWSHCSNALARHEQLHIGRQRWERPAALHHWYALPVPTRPPDPGQDRASTA